MPNTPTYIVNDQPTDRDALDFTPYVETLADIIQTGNTPLTIGVFGTWGSGKTSLMRMVRNKLPEDFTVAWFDAWKYDKEETLWRAFLLNVLFAVEKKCGETEELKTLKTMLYRGLELEKAGGVTIDLAKLGVKIAKGAIQIGLSFIPPLATLADMAKELRKSGKESVEGGFDDAIKRERTKIYVEQVRSLEQFQDKFATLVQSYATPNRLVVFVDDLDRCMPEKAIEVLEAIKLFLDATNCIFVLGLDQEVIARGIEVKYKELGAKQDDDSQQKFTIEGARYLEKIIQLPFQIPPVEQTDMGNFVEGLSADWPHEECPRVFTAGLGDNPRQIKRTVNIFLMLWKLAQKREEKLQGKVKPIRLAKVVAIQSAYPELYKFLRETPRYLRELEEYYRAESNVPIEAVPTDLLERIADGEEVDTDEIKAKSLQKTRQEPPSDLLPFISRVAVRHILTIHPPDYPDANFITLRPDELRLYFTLTRRIEVHQDNIINPQISFIEPQLIQIPAGTFLMGITQEQAQQDIWGQKDNYIQREMPQHKVSLPEYFIGKYLVTNREYNAFVRDTGYKSPAGWFNGSYPTEKADHPVMDIKWQDAVAYCDWLNTKTNKHYRLPTEAEWEKAARGTDGRVYPWGNNFDSKKCNILESGFGDTTPVGQFSPEGDSPYGCSDMIGNVWEWCNDWFDENEYRKRTDEVINPQGPKAGRVHVRRGGAFDSSIKNDVRCTYRNGHNPISYDGFRIVLSSNVENELYVRAVP